MAYTGSGILAVTVSNTEVGTISLFPKAGESYNIDLGGTRSEDDAANATVSGDRINKQNIVCSKFELGQVAWDKTVKDELAFVNKLAAAKVGSTVTVKCIDGAIYEMQNGYPVGDLQGDGSAGTFPCTFQGNPNASRL